MEAFENKPLAGLAGLRGRLPAGEVQEADAEPEGLDASLGAKIVVQRERKGRGGKTVTRVQGLEVDAAARARLMKELARAFGCGTRLEDGDILLQGAMVERVAGWLERHGAPRVIRGN